MTLQIDMASLPGHEEYGPQEFRPGDILQTRQGRFYLVVSINESTLYYFTLDVRGNVLRPGQVLMGYAENTWRKRGHVEITFGEVEWY